MSETILKHKSTGSKDIVFEPEGQSKVYPPITLSRKSGKNAFSKYLRDVNTILCRMNIITHHDEIYRLSLDRVILKLTTREETKFMELLRLFASNPEFDSIEKITNFSREQYIKQRGLVSDDMLAHSEY